jgi:hypothetical protein
MSSSPSTAIGQDPPAGHAPPWSSPDAWADLEQHAPGFRPLGSRPRLQGSDVPIVGRDALVCFFNSAGELPAARSMRVTGAVEFLDAAELVHRVSEERAALQGLIERPLEPIAEVFRIVSGEARFWTLNDILKERELETLAF